MWGCVLNNAPHKKNDGELPGHTGPTEVIVWTHY